MTEEAKPGTAATAEQATAERAVGEWDLAVGTIELVSRSENLVFKVDSVSGERFALRLHRPGYNTPSELASELLWTDALCEAGVDTPRSVRAREGRGHVEVQRPDTGSRCFASLTEWCDGEILADRILRAEGEDVVEHFQQVGEIVARLHAQATAWSPPDGFVRRRWNADGLVGETPLWGRFWEVPELEPDERDLLERARAALHRFLLELGQAPETYGVIHADLHPRNFLVGDERVLVIDFDDCGFGWHHYDLAVALFDYRERRDYPALRDALLRGYHRVRALAPEVVEALPHFLSIRSLVLLGWLDARQEFRSQSWFPAAVRRTCQEARDVLGRLGG